MIEWDFVTFNGNGGIMIIVSVNGWCLMNT